MGVSGNDFDVGVAVYTVVSGGGGEIVCSRNR